MKFLMKAALAPIVLMIDLFTWICVGLISCTSILFRIASGVISILGLAVLFTYSAKNGLILLTIAFLVSPMGLPLLTVKLLGGLQAINSSLRNI